MTGLFQLILHLANLLFLRQIFEVTLDELKCISHLSILSNLGVRGAHFSKENVFLDRGVEKNRLLHNITDLFAKILNIILRDTFTANEDVAFLHIVES